MNPVLDRLFSALETSNLITGVISVVVIFTDMYLFVQGKADLPNQLWLITGLVLGTFFGGKVQAAQALTARNLREQLGVKSRLGDPPDAPGGTA